MSIVVRIERPEGYEDVADELVLEDFCENPKAFRVELLSVEKMVKALKAVKQDAIKCETQVGPVQYSITEWAMDKVRRALV